MKFFGSAHRRGLLLSSLLLLLVGVTFWPCTQFGFLNYDDTAHVAQNPYFSPVTAGHVWYFWRLPFSGTPPTDVVHPSGFISPPYEALYGPLSFTVWAGLAMLAHLPGGKQLVASPWQFNPHVFHTANLLLHMVCALLVFGILGLLIKHRWAAFAGAVAFALHPLVVEPVAWVTGMNTLLSTALALLATWMFLMSAGYRAAASDAEQREPESANWYWTSCFVFLLAILAKPSVSAMPVLVLALLWGAGDRRLVRRMLQLVPWAVCSAFTILINMRLGSDSGFDPSIAVAPALRPFLVADSLTFYLTKLFWPFNLVPDYGRKPHWVLLQSEFHWSWIVPLTITLVLVWRAWRPEHRHWRLALAGWVVFAFTLAQTSGLVPFYFHKTSLVADRYTYLALLGTSLWIALAVAWLIPSETSVAETPAPVVKSANRSTLAIVLVGALALALALDTHAQLPEWSSDGALWRATMRVTPQSPDAYRILASGELGRGRPAAALALLGRSLAHNPDDWRGWNVAAKAQLALKNVAIADEYLRRSLAIHPEDAEAHGGLGQICLQRNDPHGAIVEFGKAIEIDPSDAGAWANFGTTAGKLGQPALAREYLTRALNLGFDRAAGELYLGIALAQEGQLDAAAQLWEQSLALNPNFFETHYNLGLYHYKHNDMPRAFAQFRDTIRLEPNYAPAYLDLARVLLRVDHPADARRALQHGLGLKPKWPEAQALLKTIP